MNMKLLLLIACSLFFLSCSQPSEKTESAPSNERFRLTKDLLLLHYDCKTDVDDLHAIAGFASFLTLPDYQDLSYHAVVGTYGTQEGLYVPPNDLAQLAFGDNWTDAHADFDPAVSKVKALALPTLQAGGNLWIAEGGQSDFSAALVKSLKAALPELNTQARIHLVQHSDWNEKVTGTEALAYVKAQTSYHRIPDGNATGNGTPGFHLREGVDEQLASFSPELRAIWQLAIDLGHQYNGVDGRYLNKTTAEGGWDFSDFSEVCWMLNLEGLRGAEEFFDLVAP